MASNVAFAGSVPANYEKYLGPFLFEPYALDLVKRLPKGSLNNVLETACGTGRVTRHLVDALAANGKIVATDLNADMLSVAREKVTDSRINCQVADAQDLPFDDNSFDAVVCQYGVMFFPEKPKAFSEAYRVLKTGGSFIFNCWDNLDKNPATDIINKVLKEEFGTDAPTFLEQAPYSFFDQAEIRRLMQEAAFKDVKLEVLKINSRYNAPEVVINGFLDGTPLSAYLADKDPGKKSAVRKKSREQLVDRFGEIADKVNIQAIICEGVK